jgi:hypothetical protein
MAERASRRHFGFHAPNRGRRVPSGAKDDADGSDMRANPREDGLEWRLCGHRDYADMRLSGPIFTGLLAG